MFSDFDTSKLAVAFSLTLLAGLATGIGSATALFAKRTNRKLLASSLGISGGVMVYISFMDLMPLSGASLSVSLGSYQVNWIRALSFFGGILISSILDRFVPESYNPHEYQRSEAIQNGSLNSTRSLYRMGILSAITIAFHNFPEGIATFSVAMSGLHLGFPLAVAIAIHNIPEGIAVAIPIFYATGSRKKAFFLSFASGLAEPLGGVIGFTVLYPFLSTMLDGIMYGIVAGIMVFISMDELLPAAEKYGEHHLVTYGFIAGMGIMALSLLMFL